MPGVRPLDRYGLIGAGPAGILLCAEAYLRLTENTSKSGRSLIYWYDKDDFQSGMLKQYDVPANTKLDYLDKRLKFFTESPIQSSNLIDGYSKRVFKYSATLFNLRESTISPLGRPK